MMVEEEKIRALKSFTVLFGYTKDTAENAIIEIREGAEGVVSPIS